MHEPGQSLRLIKAKCFCKKPFLTFARIPVLNNRTVSCLCYVEDAIDIYFPGEQNRIFKGTILLLLIYTKSLERADKSDTFK